MKKQGERGKSFWWWVTLAGGDPAYVRDLSKSGPDEQSQVTHMDFSRSQKLDRGLGQVGEAGSF